MYFKLIVHTTFISKASLEEYVQGSSFFARAASSQKVVIVIVNEYLSKDFKSEIQVMRYRERLGRKRSQKIC